MNGITKLNIFYNILIILASYKFQNVKLASYNSKKTSILNDSLNLISKDIRIYLYLNINNHAKF